MAASTSSSANDSTDAASQMQYAPFSSALDAGFWHQLSEKKLNVYGLDETSKKIHGFYNNGTADGIPSQMSVDYTAFESEPKTPIYCFCCVGTLYNTNTIDKFKTCDKKELLQDIGNKIWDDITSGKAISDPLLLSRFLLLTHANLKKYHYYYWFAFPCLSSPFDVTMVTKSRSLDSCFSSVQQAHLIDAYDEFQKGHSRYQPYFVVCEDEQNVSIQRLEQFIESLGSHKKVMLGFADPCSLPTNPGWPLRNLLILFAYHWAKTVPQVEVLCFRDRTKDGVREITHSIVMTLAVPSLNSLQDCPKCVGWEKNERQKMGPRMVNLSASMDPSKLAESAVGLNLKLMRWRLLPELKLEKVLETKCLLLGAGTLGCNVARCLMGWGVRTLTLVDNGSVSYSNPVRQSLFVFDDCVGGGKPKAETAADALKKIYPGVNATGLTLSIPMPGHPVSEGSMEQTLKDIKILEELVDSHDVLFLLLDTRESRWLPTLLGAAKKKIVICAALGFDTFLVMRHGMKTNSTSSPAPPISSSMIIPGDCLGCYFCNDVVAPGDSTKDRTLDQQCTVSRPGMSYISSALATELLVSVLQHADGALAPADTSAKEEHLDKDLSCALGLIPHQIRGFLSRFHQVLPASRAFDKCTACSDIVVNSYKEKGTEFLLKAFNDAVYLEDLTGLTAMHQESMEAEIWGFSEDEEFSSMETTN